MEIVRILGEVLVAQILVEDGKALVMEAGLVFRQIPSLADVLVLLDIFHLDGIVIQLEHILQYASSSILMISIC